MTPRRCPICEAKLGYRVLLFKCTCPNCRAKLRVVSEGTDQTTAMLVGLGGSYAVYKVGKIGGPLIGGLLFVVILAAIGVFYPIRFRAVSPAPTEDA